MWYVLVLQNDDQGADAEVRHFSDWDVAVAYARYRCGSGNRYHLNEGFKRDPLKEMVFASQGFWGEIRVGRVRAE